MPATALVEDGEGYKELLWIIKNKGRSSVWKEQICRKIEELKNCEWSHFYNNWVDWDTFIRNKVKEGVLSEKCLSMTEDGGGKQPAKASFEMELVQSPLKVKLPRCKIHDLVEETNKRTAKKGPGYILDGITCEDCNKEFVEQASDALNQQNAIVISYKSGAWWCQQCKMVLCSMCHNEFCQKTTSTKGKGRRVVNMNAK